MICALKSNLEGLKHSEQSFLCCLLVILVGLSLWLPRQVLVIVIDLVMIGISEDLVYRSLLFQVSSRAIFLILIVVLFVQLLFLKAIQTLWVDDQHRVRGLQVAMLFAVVANVTSEPATTVIVPVKHPILNHCRQQWSYNPSCSMEVELSI